MNDETKDHFEYAHKMRDESLRLTQEVFRQNELLRERVAEQERELAEKGEELASAHEAAKYQVELGRMVAHLEEQIGELKAKSLEAEAEAHQDQRKLKAVETRLGETANESRAFSEQYAQIEAYNTNLMNLYVTSHLLHETLDREQVLEAIRETVINLVGSEEFVVFELDAEGQNLVCVTSCGLDPGGYGSLPTDDGPIGRAIRSEGIRCAAALAAEGATVNGRAPFALVPLRLDGKPYGAIVVFSLLAQKAGLTELDFEILDLLSTHAATALYGSRLHAERTR